MAVVVRCQKRKRKWKRDVYRMHDFSEALWRPLMSTCQNMRTRLQQKKVNKWFRPVHHPYPRKPNLLAKVHFIYLFICLFYFLIKNNLCNNYSTSAWASNSLLLIHVYPICSSAWDELRWRLKQARKVRRLLIVHHGENIHMLNVHGCFIMCRKETVNGAFS